MLTLYFENISLVKQQPEYNSKTSVDYVHLGNSKSSQKCDVTSTKYHAGLKLDNTLKIFF